MREWVNHLSRNKGIGTDAIKIYVSHVNKYLKYYMIRIDLKEIQYPERFHEEKYSKFLISKPTELLLKDEVTKVMQLFIHNPHKPTRIIGLGGSNPGSIWSWKEVAHIHMSDIAASSRIDDAEAFGAAFSRLANTNGTMLIESPPRMPFGMIYKIFEMSKLKKNIEKDSAMGQFKIHEIPATMAVDAGLINPEFLDAERERLGPMHPMYYECDFYNSSSTWYKPEYFKYGNYGDDM